MWLLRACPRCGGDLVQERAMTWEDSPDYVCFQCGRHWSAAALQQGTATRPARQDAPAPQAPASLLASRRRAQAMPARLYAA